MLPIEESRGHVGARWFQDRDMVRGASANYIACDASVTFGQRGQGTGIRSDGVGAQQSLCVSAYIEIKTGRTP